MNDLQQSLNAFVQIDGSIMMSDNTNMQVGDGPYHLDNYRYCWDWWYQYYMPVYQPIQFATFNPDKGKQAIAIMKALMDKNIVKIKTVEDFVKAIDVVLNVI